MFVIHKTHELINTAQPVFIVVQQYCLWPHTAHFDNIFIILDLHHSYAVEIGDIISVWKWYKISIKSTQRVIPAHSVIHIYIDHRFSAIRSCVVI